MGHDISGFTHSGQRIKGPHFPRFRFPQYDIFDAWHHNDGVSGSGGSEPMTPEKLQRARQACWESLESSKQTVKEIEEEIRNTPPTSVIDEDPRGHTSDKPKLYMIVSGNTEEPPGGSNQKQPKPQLTQAREIFDPPEWEDDAPLPPKKRLRYARYEVVVFQELLDFIDQCLAEDVVSIKFW